MKLITRKNITVKGFTKAMLSTSAYYIRKKSPKSTENLIDFTFNVNTSLPHIFFYPLTPDQDKAEVTKLLKLLANQEIKNVLEVGTGHGGMLYLFSQLAKDDAKLFSIDLYAEDLQHYFLKRIVGANQKVVTVSLDSHDEKTLDTAKVFFGGEPVDLLYIDGEHSFESVSRDYELYSSLVRKGGWIVFHDIADSKLGVIKLWNSLTLKNKFEIIGHNYLDKYGTGVIVN